MLKRIIIIAVNALCFTGFFICLGVSSSIKAPLRSQQAAAAWAGQSGERFSQISVFFPDGEGLDMDGIRSLQHSLNRALLAESFESTEERILFTDAWSAEADITIISDRSPAPTSAKAFAVGGDFFMFHPLNLRDGSYLSPNDVMKDRVVIDESLAWRLFGAIKVSGFEVLINNRPFVIAGVVSREDDFASNKAYNYGAGLFMSYDALIDMTEGEAKIETYEAVLPDPISGFALSLLPVEIRGDDTAPTSAHIVENTTRFSLGKLFSIIGSFGERSMRTDGVQYPYWENAARYAEDWLAFVLVLSLFFIAFPIVCAIFYTVKLIRFGVKVGIIAIKKLIDKKDKRSYEKYILEHGEDGEASYNVNDIIREVHDEIF